MNEADMWDQYRRWDCVLPPSRPSAAHLDIFRGYVADESAERIAILGSTPEFRDLAQDAGKREVTLFDRNASFSNAMTGLMVAKPAGERLIVGDWLETLRKFPSSFDLIVSDLTLGNVRYEDHPAFYELVMSALRPHGRFVDKVLTHPLPHESAALLLNKYQHAPLNLLTVNFFSCELLFCSDLLSQHEIVDSSLFYDQILKINPSPRIERFVHESSEKVTPRDCVWYYGRYWSDVSRSYCVGYDPRIVFEETVASPYCGRLKIFCTVKQGV